MIELCDFARLVSSIGKNVNSRVRKRNLRGSERQTEHDSPEIELC